MLKHVPNALVVLTHHTVMLFVWRVVVLSCSITSQKTTESVSLPATVLKTGQGETFLLRTFCHLEKMTLNSKDMDI